MPPYSNIDSLALNLSAGFGSPVLPVNKFKPMPKQKGSDKLVQTQDNLPSSHKPPPLPSGPLSHSAHELSLKRPWNFRSQSDSALLPVNENILSVSPGQQRPSRYQRQPILPLQPQLNTQLSPQLHPPLNPLIQPAPPPLQHATVSVKLHAPVPTQGEREQPKIQIHKAQPQLQLQEQIKNTTPTSIITRTTQNRVTQSSQTPLIQTAESQITQPQATAAHNKQTSPPQVQPSFQPQSQSQQVQSPVSHPPLSPNPPSQVSQLYSPHHAHPQNSNNKAQPPRSPTNMLASSSNNNSNSFTPNLVELKKRGIHRRDLVKGSTALPPNMAFVPKIRPTHISPSSPQEYSPVPPQAEGISSPLPTPGPLLFPDAVSEPDPGAHTPNSDTSFNSVVSLGGISLRGVNTQRKETIGVIGSGKVTHTSPQPDLQPSNQLPDLFLSMSTPLIQHKAIDVARSDDPNPPVTQVLDPFSFLTSSATLPTSLFTSSPLHPSSPLPPLAQSIVLGTSSSLPSCTYDLFPSSLNPLFTPNMFDPSCAQSSSPTRPTHSLHTHTSSTDH